MSDKLFNREIEKEVKRVQSDMKVMGIPCTRAKAMKILIDMAKLNSIGLKRKPRSKEVLYEF